MKPKTQAVFVVTMTTTTRVDGKVVREPSVTESRHPSAASAARCVGAYAETSEKRGARIVMLGADMHVTYEHHGVTQVTLVKTTVVQEKENKMNVLTSVKRVVLGAAISAKNYVMRSSGETALVHVPGHGRSFECTRGPQVRRAPLFTRVKTWVADRVQAVRSFDGSRLAPTNPDAFGFAVGQILAAVLGGCLMGYLFSLGTLWATLLAWWLVIGMVRVVLSIALTLKAAWA